MKRLVLGTAGHIDHGKTALIKALTGIDTDRLKEEKERGITIELGFAHLDLPSTVRLGIIDVPGHEKFVKNMVAGAGTIDITALIIAADSGIMPQTVEHMNILKLLGVDTGIVVITKTDLVEEDFIDLVEEEIIDFVSGTFLEDAPVVRVSSTTREGLDELVSTLDDMVSKVEGKRASGIFRLPIDRVFTMKGFGTVITGTILSGGVKSGEEIEIMPEGEIARVRGLQVHEESIDEATAGTRTAINLSGLEKERIHRGDVLVSPGSVDPTYMIDAKLTYLKESGKRLKNRERVRFHIGTSEVESNVILMDREELVAGEEAFIQIRLTEPLCALPGDRFVMRSLSPTYTIGGGEVLNAHPKKHKRFKDEVIEDFETLTSGGPEDRVALFLKVSGYPGTTRAELSRGMGIIPDDAGELLKKLKGKNIVVPIGKERYLHKDSYERAKELLTDLIRDYHKMNPTREGISKDELQTRMPWGVDSRLVMGLLDDLERGKEIAISGNLVTIKGHKITLDDKEEEIIGKAKRLIGEAGLSPPSTQELSDKLSVDENELKKLLKAVVSKGQDLVRVKENLYFEAKGLESLKEGLISYLKENGEIDAQAMKELTGTTRKYTIPLLEYFDSEKVTIRVGNVRKLREGMK